ncbi:RbsD/FucU domain-containing protein [Flammeovirga pacifica]|uniref:D-ribose pyranase n=1 Tax=Flammeovirga pacifica TaxID=915059 RepID=A0A1S1YUU5_FLAPC|nr:RbsD/FucU domain-containing protein [Flammeovirga pacifica]OHX64643.1 hypothetical protein NH26_24030 [Flammeovirga pacifica]
MIKRTLIFTLAFMSLWSCKTTKEAEVTTDCWKNEVTQTLALYGHRNWIVVADAAYPQQSNPAIKTMTINATQLEAVEFIRDKIKEAKHVDATIFLDKEMKFVMASAAPGIDEYRNKLKDLISTENVQSKLHEEIICELDTSAELFHVLIIKTDLTIPYSSVFFQLECGYWNAASEKKLRIDLNKN